MVGRDRLEFGKTISPGPVWPLLAALMGSQITALLMFECARESLSHFLPTKQSMSGLLLHVPQPNLFQRAHAPTAQED